VPSQPLSTDSRTLGESRIGGEFQGQDTKLLRRLYQARIQAFLLVKSAFAAGVEPDAEGCVKIVLSLFPLVTAPCIVGNAGRGNAAKG
jgi:hypothetical protein